MTDFERQSEFTARLPDVPLPPRTASPGRLPATAHLAPRAQVFLMAAPGAEAAPGPDALGEVATSSGEALPEGVRQRFEGSLGADLSGVRLHTGQASNRAARAVGARAFAIGNDIHFAAGQFAPTDPFGLHLLAHEVAHTVQQGGRPIAAAAKLEVSRPGDAVEVDADRAADAMVQGAPVRVMALTGAPAVARAPDPEVIPEIVITADEARTPTITGEPGPDLRPPAEQLLPRPYYWDRGAGGEVDGEWTEAPVASVEAMQGGIGPAQAEAFRVAQEAKQAFVGHWNAAKSNWGAVHPEMAAYKTAAADAEKKGLLDLDGKSGDLDRQVEDSHLPGADKSVGEAFNKDGSVGGKHNYDAKKLDREERLAIDKGKKEVANKTGEVKTSEGEAKNKQNSLLNAGNDLANAKADLDGVREEAKKQNLEQQVVAMEKSCALIGQAISGAFATGTGEGKAGAAAAGGEAAVGMINTLYWDAQIRTVQGEIQVINGGLSAIAKIKAMNGIENAKRNVENAIRDVQAAHRAYDKAMRERSVAFQELSTLMEKAAKKSGASAKDAAAVGVAVQAVPALEYVVEVTGKIARLVNPPACDQRSAQGAALHDGATQAIMSDRVGALRATTKAMGEAEAKWRQRLDSVNALLKGAR